MQRLYTVLSIMLPSTVVILLFLQFVLSNGLATVGNEVHTTDKEIELYSDENDYLKKQLAVAQSLEVIEKKAEDLGFTKPTKFVTLPVSEPVALR